MRRPQLKLPFDTGIYYIPVPFGKKGPVNKGWNSKENCINDAKNVEKLNGINVGLATAYSGIVHLDIDNYKLARQLLEAKYGINLRKIIEQSKSVFWSGRKGSIGVLFRVPYGIQTLDSVMIHHDRVVALEFRCGTKEGLTGNSIIPPSVHPSGTKYKWIKGDLTTITTLPLALTQLWILLQKQQKQPKIPTAKSNAKKSSKNATTAPLETPRNIAVVKDQLRFISPDCDYVTWRAVVWGILSTGWVCAEQLAREWSLGAPELFNEKLFNNLIHYFKSGYFSPGTIWFMARQGGWNG